jgi:hypothetical protein
MKSLLSSFRAKDSQPKALPAPQIPTYDPDLFFPKKAGNCKRIRTRARMIDGDSAVQTWLQAVEVSPMAEWLVSRVEKSVNLDRVKDLPPDAPVITVAPQGKPVSLREAATRLAEFEHGALANESFTGPGKEELGDLHYETALAKENIVFDTSGQPHATVNGMIVDQGFFTEEAYENALKAKAAQTKDEAGNISVLGIAEAMGTEDLMTALENRAYLVKFSKSLKSIQAGLEECLKDKYDGRFTEMDKFFENSGYRSYQYYSAVGNPLGQLDKQLEGLKGTPMHQSLLLFVYQYQLFALTTILVDAYKHFEKVTDKDDIDEMGKVIDDGLKHYISETCRIMEKNGANPDKLRQFRNLVLLQNPSESMEQMKFILG